MDARTFGLQTLLGLSDPPWIIGHRGACGHSPENTIESFRLAVSQGANMIEMDLQLTADAYVVVVHDWSLERLAGIPRIVETSTLGEIQKYNVARYFRPEGPPASIPTLASVFDAIDISTPCNLELKCKQSHASTSIKAVAGVIGHRNRLVLSSFDWNLLRECRCILPNKLSAPLAHNTLDCLLDVAQELSAVSVNCHHNLIDREFVKAANACGYPVLAYTVNDAVTAKRLFELGVSGAFTDVPGQLLDNLRSF